MPRYISNPQGINKFPGEIVFLIVRELLDGWNASDRTVTEIIKATLYLTRLSWKFKLSVDRLIGLHFHDYLQPATGGVHDHNAPFHVSVYDTVAAHREYWQHFLGNDARKAPEFRDILRCLTKARLPDLRRVSLDLRAQEPQAQSSLRLWKTKHAPRWVQTSTILSWIDAASKGLEELNVRLSPQQELIDLVESIIRDNKRLHTVRIEVDSAVVSGRNIRPSIKLHNMFPNGHTRAALKVFEIRAPSCDVHFTATGREQQLALLNHFQQTEDFILVCFIFDAMIPTIMWLYRALRHMPKVKRFDFAVDRPDRHHVQPRGDKAPRLELHCLEKLSIQTPEVDGHLLRVMNAPSLYKLRIQSAVDIDTWPSCPPKHFPNLFIAHMCCPGASAPRISALGVPYRSFAQNLGLFHNWTRTHGIPFLCYIKPYTSRRFQPPAPTQAWAPPPPVSDASSELTELSDSDDLWPDSQPVPAPIPALQHNPHPPPPAPAVSAPDITTSHHTPPTNGVASSSTHTVSDSSPSVTFTQAITALSNPSGASQGTIPAEIGSSSAPAPKRRRYV
ncbi:hypothetical protein CF326_g2115 [Tilletia indica]|nr:hypothetical protein CF326_g2115 [Tilletia indica]